MDKISGVVQQQNENKHMSRLVEAAGFISNEAPYFSEPKGVWGRMAIIESNNVKLKSSELDFEFEIKFDDNLESEESEIIVYNLSTNTINQLKAGAGITIKAGYGDDIGLIFDGYIKKVSTKRQNADKVTTIKISDSARSFENVNIPFGKNARASDILLRLLARTKYKLYTNNKAKFADLVERNFYYKEGVTINESLDSAIKQFSEDCGVSSFVSNGVLLTCSVRKVPNRPTFDVSENTGMIESPVPFEEEIRGEVEGEEYTDKIEGVEIDMLLQHRMSVGALIRLRSEENAGRYYVKSGSHTFNESECVTKVKAVH